MTVMTTSKARANLYKLIDQASRTHEPIQIVGRRTSAVLIDAEDWKSIQETLYLSSIPKVKKSIIEGLKTPLSKCSKKVQW